MKNQQAMKNMTTIINKVLDMCYDSIDTCIAVNCHVLASTYFIVEDQLEIQLDQIENLSVEDKANRVKSLGDQVKTGKSVYLFERIKTHDIWKNTSFWDRTLCQNIYYEVLEQIKSNLMDQSGGQPLNAALDQQLPEVLKLPMFCTIDDCLNYKSRISKIEDKSPTETPAMRGQGYEDEILIVEVSEIIFSKLLQIQFDMVSFDVPIDKIRTLVKSYLDVPNLVQPGNADIIMS